MVTGANSGVGREVSRVLALRKALVIMGCRSLKKGEEVKEELRKMNPSAKLVVMELNLSSLKSIIKFGEQFRKQFSHLDIFIQNAATAFLNGTTEEGLEISIGSNYFGHFFLTQILLESLKNATNLSRIVTVTSFQHKTALSLELERIFSLSESYMLQKEAYALSKLYNFLLAKELAKHYEKEGVIANTADTGIVLLTNITNNLNPFEMIHLFF